MKRHIRCTLCQVCCEEHPERDPVTWRLFGSQFIEGPFDLLDEQTNRTRPDAHTLSFGRTRFRNLGIDTMKLLLTAGADIHQKNKQGETPLFLAAETGAEEYFKLLLSYAGRHDLNLLDAKLRGQETVIIQTCVAFMRRHVVESVQLAGTCRARLLTLLLLSTVVWPHPLA